MCEGNFTQITDKTYLQKSYIIDSIISVSYTHTHTHRKTGAVHSINRVESVQCSEK